MTSLFPYSLVKSAKTPVIGIKGGLIDDIYVVNNELPVMLISNTHRRQRSSVQDKTP
jgi:hypothetical protein